MDALAWYDFSFDKNRNEDDLIFKYHNTEILIDEMSLTFLDGNLFIDDLSGSFQVNNPNASSSLCEPLFLLMKFASWNINSINLRKEAVLNWIITQDINHFGLKIKCEEANFQKVFLQIIIISSK